MPGGAALWYMRCGDAWRGLVGGRVGGGYRVKSGNPTGLGGFHGGRKIRMRMSSRERHCWRGSMVRWQYVSLGSLCRCSQGLAILGQSSMHGRAGSFYSEGSDGGCMPGGSGGGVPRVCIYRIVAVRVCVVPRL